MTGPREENPYARTKIFRRDRRRKPRRFWPTPSRERVHCAETVTSEGILGQTAEQRVGAVLMGKWTLDRLIGTGGMACVYAATHRNGSEVAIKILHPECSFNQGLRERFLREGYAANNVKHPGAVHVFDDDVTEDGAAFLVMELLDGETLDGAWEANGRKLPAQQVLPVIDQILDIMGCAHERGIFHRDLKPENIFLTRDGGVKVLDFGIARLQEQTSSSTATKTGSLMGTPSFMPPEQARGRWDEVDGQTDVWAIGATVFTLISGQYVHEAGTVNEALAKAITTPARSIGSVDPSLPEELVRWVDRALAYEKVDRWPDARAMRAALPTIESDTSAQDAVSRTQSDAPANAGASPERPSETLAPLANTQHIPGLPRPSNGRRVGLLVAAAAALVLVGGTGAFLAMSPSSGSPVADADPVVDQVKAVAPKQPLRPASAASAAPAAPEERESVPDKDEPPHEERSPVAVAKPSPASAEVSKVDDAPPVARKKVQKRKEAAPQRAKSASAPAIAKRSDRETKQKSQGERKPSGAFSSREPLKPAAPSTGAADFSTRH